MIQPKGSIYLLCFFAGAALNWLTLTKVQGVVLVVAGCLFGAYQNHSQIFVALPSITSDPKTFYDAIGAILLVGGVCVSGSCSRIFTSPLAQYLGRISYCLYLVHFIVLGSLASFVIARMGTGAASLLVAAVGYLGLSIALAQGLTRFVDIPAIAISARFARWVAKQPATDDKAT